MKEWKTLDREVVYQNDKYLTVENHKIELHDGSIIENWPWVITGDYVNVIVVNEDQKFVCFKQTKYGVKGISIAPIGGHIEPNEEPFAAAKRELLEEAGYASESWTDLGSFRVDPNRGCANAYLYLAQGAKKIQEPNSDDLEEQELIFLSRDEILNALSNGEVKVLSWAFAFTKSLSLVK